MSANLLEHQLTTLRRRVRHVLIANGISWTAIVAVGAILVACLGDWLFHFDDPVVRLLLGLATAAGTGWIIHKRLWTPLRLTLSDVELAQSIEARFPEFADSLASSVQFIQSGQDSRLGSPELQQAVVAATMNRLHGLNIHDVIQTRPVQRVLGIAAAVCTVAALSFLIDHSATTTALARLCQPFSGPHWPRQTNLRFLHEDLTPLDLEPGATLRMARGESLKMIVENSTGRLPAHVNLEVRRVNGTAEHKVQVEPLRPTTIKSADGQHVAVAVGQLHGSTEDLEFRAVGGDDTDMEWRRLQVVVPPTLERLQVTVTPPVYSGRAVEHLPAGVGNLEGLVGSRVSISAQATTPLSRSRLRLVDQSAIEVAISPDGLKLDATFLIDKPGTRSWWFELTDSSGFTNPDPLHYEFRGLADAEPEIVLNSPAVDEQTTASAIVRLQTTARDDLGLKEMRLVYRIEPGDSTTEQIVTLFPTDAVVSAELSATTNATSRTQQIAEYAWNLAPLNLVAGSRLIFRTEATDDFDLAPEFAPEPAPPPHLGRSSTRTLTIATTLEKSREISQKQAGLIAELDRVHKQQNQARQQIDDLGKQLKNGAGVRPEDLDSLQRTELSQREIAAQLTNPETGLARRSTLLNQERQDNQIDDPQAARHLQEITRELERLQQEHLGQLDQLLTESRKLIQSAARKPDSGSANAVAHSADVEHATQVLERVADDQQAVSETLGELLQELTQWRGEQDAAAELNELARQQTELNARTATLSQATLTKGTAELTPQDRADLAKLAERQKKQAEQLEQFENRLNAHRDSPTDGSPAAADMLQSAAQQSQQQGIAGQMREAADQIGANRMGLATRNQQEILQKLRDLEQKLDAQRDDGSEMLIKKQKQAESELSELRDRQRELLKKLQSAEQLNNPAEHQEQLERLRTEQAQAEEDTQRLSRQLARLEARQAQISAARAAARMQDVQQQLAEYNPGQATESAQESLDDLEQALRELTKRRQLEEEVLARESLARIGDQLAALATRQQAAIDETLRLDQLHSEAGKWLRTQLLALRDLAKTQRDLQSEAQHLSDLTGSAQVIHLALSGVARSMETAAQGLEAKETGDATQGAQQAVMRRLTAIIAALKDDENSDSKISQENESQRDDQSPTGDRQTPLAQLKLIVVLQKELLARTAEIERLRHPDQALSAAATTELEALSREQSELTDLLQSLVSPQVPDSDAADTQPESQTPEKPVD
ncbi:MAG: hypothetical protein JSS02_30335 [Planctomycetes bacterium]|nr:hypothetical protein [Planctomycetota bacterium]